MIAVGPWTIEAGWLWAIGGLALLIAEVIAPGFFLAFLGMAAVVTGLATLALDLSGIAQVALFAILAALAIMVGRTLYGKRDLTNDDPLLNDRGQRLIGRNVMVVDPVDAHGGRVRVGDSEWSARGGPAAAGASVVIVAVEGNCLLVEPIAS